MGIEACLTFPKDQIITCARSNENKHFQPFRAVCASTEMNGVNASKSSNDLKDYELHTLASGLEVLLVSTERLHASKGQGEDDGKAAAAMCVDTGSFCDPTEAEGLAHFLEHMVFMGSAK